jgi:hypothetical protein
MPVNPAGISDVTLLNEGTSGLFHRPTDHDHAERLTGIPD